MVKTVKAHDVNLSSKNTTSWAWLGSRLQPVAEINLVKPQDISCFRGYSGYFFCRVVRPQFMPQAQARIPEEEIMQKHATGIGAAQKYDAAQIDKLEGLEAVRKRP